MHNAWAASHSGGQDNFALEPQLQRQAHETARSSLGQFIERSTSAPPASSGIFKSDPQDEDSFDLLSHVSRVYHDKNHEQNATMLADATSEFHGLQLDEDRRHHVRFDRAQSAGPASAHIPELVGERDHYATTRPLSANGEDDNFAPAVSSRSNGNSGRSQSAAPSFSAIGPPPGLGRLSSSNHSASEIFGRIPVGARRAQSTGVLLGSSGSALRPAAKTLMDLIQEDFPAESEQLEPQQRRSAGGSPTSSMPDQQRHWQQEQKESGDRPPFGTGSQHHSTNHAYGHSPHGVVETPIPAFNGDDERTMGRNGSSTQPSLQHAYISSQIPPYQAKNAPFDIQQIHQVQPGQYFVPQQHHERPAYYHDARQQSGASSSQGLYFQGTGNRQGIPAQLLSAGQLMYSTAAPTSSQETFGYENARYSQTTQQPHLPQPQQVGQQQLPTNSLRGDGGQYVSVLPVQGQQQLYWQDDVRLRLAPVAIVGASSLDQATTASPLNMRVSSDRGGGGGGSSVATNDAYAGRASRDRGGGRGRRNNNRGRGTDGRHKEQSSASPVLDEFRSSKNRDWTLFQISGHVVEFCQDQNGSRFIQQRLEMGDVSEQLVAAREVLPAIRRLRNDVFGNYVVQKLLDFGTAGVKAEIRTTLEGEMLVLSFQMYGCRVVQKALEKLDESDLPNLLKEFHHNVLSCIHDQNGNHVIQKCIEVMCSKSKSARSLGDHARADYLVEQVGFIINDVLHNATTLACHPYGCRVLQRILEHCEDSKRLPVLDEISQVHDKLLDDQYGNYVIQHVLQYGRQEDRDSILAIVAENGLLVLARQKFASNVVEKLLKYGNSNQRRAIVREMLKEATDSQSLSTNVSGGTSVVLYMVRDAYANYVVQTTLDVVPESQEKQLLLQELHAHSEELRNYTFAKHIVAKLGTMLGESS